jgi:hypothetical protein
MQVNLVINLHLYRLLYFPASVTFGFTTMLVAKVGYAGLVDNILRA